MVDGPALARTYVQNGLGWLDQFAPAGWENRVNIPELRLSMCANCVLGFVFGDFESARVGFHLTRGKCVRLGFLGTGRAAGISLALIANEGDSVTVANNTELEGAWREAIVARLIAMSPSDRLVTTGGGWRALV